MITLQFFQNSDVARAYRKENGTGGWIFSNPTMTVLFPPEFTPSAIFNHPVTKGHEGKLIGS